jgi:hypothetical protein
VSEAGPAPCFLCGRPLRGGRETVPVHPICHRAIHRALDNKALARDYASPDALRSHPELARFLAWIADKDPDFNAPTRRPKRRP